MMVTMPPYVPVDLVSDEPRFVRFQGRMSRALSGDPRRLGTRRYARLPQALELFLRR